MSAAQAGSTATGDLSTERRWRRRCLWGLLLLFPVTIAAQAYGNVAELLRNRDILARDVVAGKEAAFAGSTWQLRKLAAAEGIDPRRLPANSVPMLADLTVMVGDPDLQKLWMLCKITLTDAAGRRWSPTLTPISSPDDLKTCNSAMFSGAKSGDTLKIRETFIVPRDAVATIRVNLSVASERPYYLRFGRPNG
jgi:hypothetical protein